MKIEQLQPGIIICGDKFPEPVKVLSYIVENAATNPTLYTIQNPALHLNPAEEVSVIRYVVNDWRYHANCESNQS